MSELEIFKKELLSFLNTIDFTNTNFNKYQELYGFPEISSTRKSDIRWNLIKDTLPEKIDSILDLGCNNGFFVFKVVETKKCIGIGVEKDPNMIQICRLLHLIAKDQHMNIGFLEHSIDPVSTLILPESDITICFSIIQHVIAASGIDGAKETMKILCKKTKKAMYFEMCSNEEEIYKEGFAFLGNNPDKWITDFLHEAGFTKVKHLGKSEWGRSIFKATKD